MLSNPHYILHFTSNTFREKKTKKTLISAEPVAFYLISLVFFFLFYKICEEKVAEAEQENHISNVNNDILVCFYIDYISDIWVFLLLQFLILWQTKAICIVLMHSPSKQLLCLSFVCYLSISSRAMPMHSVRIIIKTLIKWRNTNMIKTMTIGEMKNTHAKKNTVNHTMIKNYIWLVRKRNGGYQTHRERREKSHKLQTFAMNLR